MYLQLRPGTGDWNRSAGSDQKSVRDPLLELTGPAAARRMIRVLIHQPPPLRRGHQLARSSRRIRPGASLS